MRIRFSVPIVAFLLLVAACGGDADEFKTPSESPTALGAASVPAGTVAAPTPTQCAQQYTIVSGDTLSAVALQFDVELQALIDVNELVDPGSLHIGQQIVIPCTSSVAVTPAPTVTATAGP